MIDSRNDVTDFAMIYARLKHILVTWINCDYGIDMYMNYISCFV